MRERYQAAATAKSATPTAPAEKSGRARAPDSSTSGNAQSIAAETRPYANAAVDAHRAPIQLPHAAADALPPMRICIVVNSGELACPSMASTTCDQAFTLISKKIAVRTMSPRDRFFTAQPSFSHGDLR